MTLRRYETGSLDSQEGGKKSYVIVGDGPTPVVVVPGAGDGLRTAADVALYVAWYYRQRVETYRMLVLSRREPIPEGYSVSAHAADMIDTVEELGWGPAFWECVSAGGPIGQQVAVARPDLVRGLILSSALHHTTGRTRTVLEQWLTMADEPGGTAAMSAMIEQKFRPPKKVLTAEQWADAEVVAEIEYPGRMRNALEPLLELDHRELVGEIDCPTFVLTGSDDRFVPLELQQDMAKRIPGSRQQICEGYGHFHDLENPDYHRLVEEFIAGHE